MDWKLALLLGALIIAGIALAVCFTNSKKANYREDKFGTENRIRKLATHVKGTAITPLYLIDNFLSKEECDRIIQSSSGKTIPSLLTRPDPNDHYFRTSDTCYFSDVGGHKDIEAKICNALGIPQEMGETSQIQYYKVGKEFKPHYDAFHSGEDDDILKNGQRTWTFMVYLNDVEKGGETRFVRLNEALKPKQGQAVVWYNLDDQGNINNDTLHQGSPVIEGQKYIITKWFRDSPQ